ncbi:MAG: phosphoesterase [Gemmataceae bacterium]
MTDRIEKHVLVVPTQLFHDVGVFQGFSSEPEKYLPSLLDPQHLRFYPRAKAEADPSYKQLIPYVVFRHQDQIFHYLRGSKATETRLQAFRSVGVGGHIEPQDADQPTDLYRSGMMREVLEEVFLETEFEDRCLGLINDDSNSVGQVHLGIVHLFHLNEPNVRPREAVLTEAGFSPLSELTQVKSEFETWSQFLLDPEILGRS